VTVLFWAALMVFWRPSHAEMGKTLCDGAVMVGGVRRLGREMFVYLKNLLNLSLLNDSDYGKRIYRPFRTAA
jgi:hypothetical protein